MTTPSCANCVYWDKIREVDGLCRRFAPDSGRLAEEVAHWPSTQARQGCGDGAISAPPRVSCAECVYWRRYKGGLHPMNRSDMPNAWWARAGLCIRRAPRPTLDPGPRAFWRATGETDFCGDGVRIEDAAG